MRFAYPARLHHTGADEIVVSFQDLPECLTRDPTLAPSANRPELLVTAICQLPFRDGTHAPDPLVSAGCRT